MDCILDSFGNLDTSGINNEDEITDNLEIFIQRYITGLQRRIINRRRKTKKI